MLRRLVRLLALKVVPFASVDGLDVFFVDPDVSRDQVRERGLPLWSARLLEAIQGRQNGK